MRRREFITLLGGAAAAWPLTARAQQAVLPVIGVLHAGSADGAADEMLSFRQGLRETGHVEGQNVAIEYRWAEGQYDRLPALAADLVRRRVSVIAAIGGPPQALAAKATNTTIPIVFLIGADPVGLGLVASLSRPGGNLTGVTTLNLEVAPKRLELMHELVPAATNLALLVNPSNAINTEAEATVLPGMARTLGIDLNIVRARSERELEGIFVGLVERRPGGLVVGPDTFFQSRTELIVALAARYGIPTVTPYRRFPAAGGLASYGGSATDVYHLAGVYTGRILKGEKAADLPVQQSTKVELIINLKTAKALGLTVPISLLGRADEVIE
jgi:putative ABC transport system substrate-binding protein